MAQIGFKGQQYGLIKPPSKKQPPPSRIQLQDDEDEIIDLASSTKSQTQQKQEAEKQRKLKLVERMQQKALEEDPTIFDYDGVYDNIKQQTQPNYKARVQNQAEEQERKPRYIQALLQKAEERKVVDDLRFERKIRKEAAADEEEFGDLPKFVTQSYINKMEENQKNREEMARKDARDEDPSTKKNLSSFYTNLLVNNVAFGTGPKSDVAKPTETEQQKQNNAAAAAADKDLTPAEKARREKMREEAMAKFGNGDSASKRKEAPSPANAEETKRLKVEDSTAETPTPTTSTTTTATTTPTATTPAPEVDRTEKMSEARLRYLQRKNEGKK